jgi:hypothetical protein
VPIITPVVGRLSIVCSMMIGKSAFVTYIVSRCISLRIGGMTGDTPGVVNEWADLTVLICSVSLSL